MPEKEPSAETRQRQRVNFNIDVTLETGGETLNYDRSQNISMSGIFLITPEPLPLGAKGKIIIDLECGEQHYRIRGLFEVVRITEKPGQSLEEPPGMGLAFRKLDPEGSIHLYNVIRYQSE